MPQASSAVGSLSYNVTWLQVFADQDRPAFDGSAIPAPQRGFTLLVCLHKKLKQNRSTMHTGSIVFLIIAQLDNTESQSFSKYVILT